VVLAHEGDQEFIIRVRRNGQPEIYVGRRYGEFARLHKRLRAEIPGKVFPPLPRKNKSSLTTGLLGNADDDASSVSSNSSMAGDTPPSGRGTPRLTPGPQITRSASRSSLAKAAVSPRPSGEGQRRGGVTVLYREEQRVSLRAFLRTILQNKRVAESKALEEFRQAVMSDSDLPEPHYNLGLALAQSARLDEAKRELKEAISLDPKYTDARIQLGLVLSQNNDTAGAANVFRELVRRDPNFAEAHNNLGLVLLQAGDVPKARAEFSEAVRLKPRYAEAHYNLALALHQEGKEVESRAEFEQAFEIAPEFRNAPRP